MSDLVTLDAWARQHLGAGVVRVHGAPTAAGRSSDTLLFDVGDEGFVLRRPPATDAFPLFPRYDLARQVTAMRLVAERTSVPVPVVRHFEPDATVLGAPFI